MGGQQSTLVDMSQVAGFNSLPNDLQKYLQHSSDYLLALAKCACDLSVKFDARMTTYMTQDEQNEFLQLQVAKEACVDDVDKFVRVEKTRYGRMLKEVERGVSLSHLFRNSSTESQIASCDELIERLTAVKFRFVNFKAKLEQTMEEDGRSNQKWWNQFRKWSSVLSFAACAIGGIVILILHFIPGVNFCLATTELVYFSCAVGFGVAGAVAVVTLQQDELDRAMQYLDNITENLQEMKAALMDIRTGNVLLKDDQTVSQVKELLCTLCTRCDNIAKLCDQAKKAR